MKLNSELVDLHNKLTNTNIQIKVDDLIDADNCPLGTRVNISIPFQI